MTRACESSAAPTSHSATDPAEFNVVGRSKPNLLNQTDTNDALLPLLTHQLGTHQLGSAHEWSGVWNGPKSQISLVCSQIKAKHPASRASICFFLH